MGHKKTARPGPRRRCAVNSQRSGEFAQGGLARPSMSNPPGVEAAKGRRNPKKEDCFQQSSFFGASDEARTRYLHLGKVALYQMSYTRVNRMYLITPPRECQALFSKTPKNLRSPPRPGWVGPRGSGSPPGAAGRCRGRAGPGCPTGGAGSRSGRRRSPPPGGCPRRCPPG